MNVEQIFQQVMDENCPDPLHRFAELVAKGAVAKEREACAQLCNSLHDCEPEHSPDDCAEAIRARGDTK